MNRLPTILPTLAAATLAGCATPPPQQASIQLQPACSHVRIEQAGKTLAPSAGVVTVARAPFAIAYVGPGKEPSLYASTKPTMAAWLARQGRAEVWLPFGTGVAGGHGILSTDDKPQGWRDNETRKAVTEVVPKQHWHRVKAKVEARPLDVAVHAGTNHWWEPAQGNAPRVYRVAELNNDPVGKSRIAELHLVAFGETERIIGEGTTIPFVARVSWNSCTVRFAS